MKAVSTFFRHAWPAAEWLAIGVFVAITAPLVALFAPRGKKWRCFAGAWVAWVACMFPQTIKEEDVNHG